MKKCILAIFLALNIASVHAAYPTPVEIQSYKARMALYIAAKQNPNQVVVSLRNYYGRQFVAIYNYGDQTYDIVVQIGEGTNITFMETLGTMK